MKEVEHTTYKEEEIVKYYAEIIVKKMGTSGHLYLPKKLIGKKVKVELI